MGKSPNFNENFRDLDPGMTGPLRYLEVVERRALLKKATEEYQRAKKGGFSGTHHLEMVKKSILDILNQRPSDRARSARMKQWIQMHRNGCEQSAKGEVYRTDLEANAIVGLVLLYSDFKLANFEDEYVEEFQDEIEAEPTADDLRLLMNEEAKHNKWLLTPLGDKWQEKHFKRIPPIVGTLRQDNSEELDRALAYLDFFVKEYRRRCKLFTVPVTISGVRMSTLPESIRPGWELLYEKMGLKPGPRNIFYATDCDLRDETGPDGDGQVGQIPETFTKLDPE